MPDESELQQLLRDVQSQLAFQEDAISSLDDALAQQQQEIMQLRRQLQLLGENQKEQAAMMDARPSSGPEDEKPPHY